MVASRSASVVIGVIIGMVLLCAASHTTLAQQSARLVEAIEIQGNRRLRDEDIFDNIKTRPGQLHNVEQVQRDFRAVLALGVFDRNASKVFTEEGARGGLVVIFEVTELPLISDIRFKGLSNVSESQLVAAISEANINLVKGSVCDHEKLREASRVIKRTLAELGWTNSVVEVLLDVETSTETAITFVIDEQP